MLKSKLLTLFIAFALVITVGGVYATWTYTSDDATSANVPGAFSPTISINDATEVGAPGTVSVNSDNAIAYTINNGGSYNTILNDNDGKYVISYAPADGSPYQTINLQCTVTIQNKEYLDQDIFSFASDAAVHDHEKGEITITLTKANVGSGDAAWTIGVDDIGLQATEFTLNTHDKWEAYQLLLKSCKIVMNITALETAPSATVAD
jgi:hypothetical protein